MPVTNLPSTADSGALLAQVLCVLICLLGGCRGHGPLIQGSTLAGPRLAADGSCSAF